MKYFLNLMFPRYLTLCTGTNKDVRIVLFSTISRKPPGQDEAVTVKKTQDEDARIVVPCYITIQYKQARGNNSYLFARTTKHAYIVHDFMPSNNFGKQHHTEMMSRNNPITVIMMETLNSQPILIHNYRSVKFQKVHQLISKASTCSVSFVEHFVLVWLQRLLLSFFMPSSLK